MSIVEPDKDRQFFKSVHGLREPWATRQQTPLSQSFCKHVRDSGHPLVVSDARKHPLVENNGAISELNVIAYLGVPIKGIYHETIGALCAIDDHPRDWTTAEIEKMWKFANFVNDQIQLRVALRISEQHRNQLSAEIDSRREIEANLQILATTDPLTGVLNRRAFKELAETEISRCRRYGGELGVVVIDLDRFKTVNDTYGHEAGDLVLKEVSKRVEETIRAKIDVFARVGGEEFALLLPGTEPLGAIAAAERCRLAISERAIRFTADAEVLVTASFGVASRSSRHESIDELLKRADKAMYAAKAAGRNTVLHWDRLADANVVT